MEGGFIVIVLLAIMALIVIAKTAVEIHAPGKVKGNITTPVLVIDRGVVFEGNAKMENLSESPKVA